MAIEIIKRDLEKAIAAYSDKKLRNLLNKTAIHEITITDDISADAFVTGTNNVMKGAKYTSKEIAAINSEYNTKANWVTVVHDIYTELSSLPQVTTNHRLRTISELYKSEMKGVYLLAGSTQSAITIRLYNQVGETVETGDTNLDTFLKAYRRLAWNTWRDKFLPPSSELQSVSVEKGQKGTKFRRLKDAAVGPIQGGDFQGAYASGAFGTGIPYAHDPETTVGVEGFKRLLQQLGGDEGSQELQEALAFKGLERISFDIVQDVKDTLKLEYTEEEIDLPNGNTRVVRVIRGKLRKQGKELSDWSSIKQQILKKDGSLATVIKNTVDAMNKNRALAAEGSKSVKKRVGEKTAKRIVDNLTKTKRKTVKVAKKPKYKKPAPKKAEVKGSGNRALRKGRVTIGLSIAGKKLRRPEQEKRKATQSVFKLKSLINKRLPAEVRRNMGRPALINRTGRFSNSTELVSLRQTAAGISGEYTYKLNPYATFENLGQREWPAGYNPKPLIAKSIRNLAVQYTEQKLVSLRRI